MDLRLFYLKNVNSNEYYYKFYDLIEHVNETKNVFSGIRETQNYSFDVFDTEEAIDKLKSLCMPENEEHSNEDKCWFYCILFYLYKNGYVLEQFPRLLERPPLESRKFVYNQIRDKLIAEGKDDNGKVRYANRRAFVKNFVFNQKDHYIELGDEIETKFRKISKRDASFQEMSEDEKLAEIVNLIENMLKDNGKYKQLNYIDLCGEFINDEIIKSYRKQLQCFRHSSESSIKEMEGFNKKQKDFLIDFGIVIMKAIHSLQEDS